MIKTKIWNKAFGIIVVAGLVLAPNIAYADPGNKKTDPDAILMSANNEGFDSQLTASVLMTPNGEKVDVNEPITVVPGDVLEGTLTVRNNGANQATLNAYMVSVENSGPGDESTNPWFNEDVKLKVNGKEDDLLSWLPPEPQNKNICYGLKVEEKTLQKNETVDLDFELNVSEESTSGNDGEYSSSFNMYLTMVEQPGKGNIKPGMSDEEEAVVEKISCDALAGIPGIEVPEDNKPVPGKDNNKPGNNKPGNNGNSGNNPKVDKDNVKNLAKDKSSDKKGGNNSASDNYGKVVSTGAMIVSSPVGMVAVILGGLSIIAGGTVLMLNSRKKKN